MRVTASKCSVFDTAAFLLWFNRLGELRTGKVGCPVDKYIDVRNVSRETIVFYI